MKVWNTKYDMDNDELEHKVSALATELDIMEYEAEFELDDMKSKHENWNVDKLIEEVKKEFNSEKMKREKEEN